MAEASAGDSDGFVFSMTKSTDQDHPQRFVLNADLEKVQIGRCKKNQIKVNLPGVSWYHSEIRLMQEEGQPLKLGIVDLSSNGTGLKKSATTKLQALQKDVIEELPNGSFVVLPMKVNNSIPDAATKLRAAILVQTGEQARTPPPVPENLPPAVPMAFRGLSPSPPGLAPGPSALSLTPSRNGDVDKLKAKKKHKKQKDKDKGKGKDKDKDKEKEKDKNKEKDKDKEKKKKKEKNRELSSSDPVREPSDFFVRQHMMARKEKAPKRRVPLESSESPGRQREPSSSASPAKPARASPAKAPPAKASPARASPARVSPVKALPKKVSPARGPTTIARKKASSLAPPPPAIVAAAAAATTVAEVTPEAGGDVGREQDAGPPKIARMKAKAAPPPDRSRITPPWEHGPAGPPPRTSSSSSSPGARAQVALGVAGDGEAPRKEFARVKGKILQSTPPPPPPPPPKRQPSPMGASALTRMPSASPEAPAVPVIRNMPDWMRERSYSAKRRRGRSVAGSGASQDTE